MSRRPAVLLAYRARLMVDVVAEDEATARQLITNVVRKARATKHPSLPHVVVTDVDVEQVRPKEV